jgi:hypothetical protein
VFAGNRHGGRYTGGMAVDRFEDVRGLPEPELRVLVESGRPEERVWAIWALALRSSDIGTLGQRHEPDPGVRRNLAVVLAGHGQYDLLVALAKRDPAPEVRAAAMQLVARIAVDGKLPASLVAERVLADGIEVKIAVLGTVFFEAPAWLIELARQLVDDDDSDVRYEAFEALMRAGVRDHALMWLEEAPEAEARLAVLRWSARGQVQGCATVLSGASRRLRRLLVESVRVANWGELAPAVGDEPALIRAVARRVPNVFHDMPLVTLLRATLREPSDPWIVMVSDRLAALESPDDEISDLLHDYRDICATRIGHIDVLAADMRKQRDPQLAHELELLDDQRVALETALGQALRLLVH